MVFASFSEEIYLSFAISILVFFYLVLVVLESPWSNSGGVCILPLDCCFPTLRVAEKMSTVSDSKGKPRTGVLYGNLQ
ncbi:hypothetical protein I3843_01G092200 [Carya illinoinensis]|nr:hypothetical protein I3843_01G092200 [Carya illinoinensis]